MAQKQSFLMLTQGHIDDMVLALVKTFDKEGKVRGDDRFFLFSSRALNGSGFDRCVCRFARRC